MMVQDLHVRRVLHFVQVRRGDGVQIKVDHALGDVNHRCRRRRWR
jgi:hypothetical protein